MQLFDFPEEYTLLGTLRETPGRELQLWENTRLHKKLLLRHSGCENEALYESLCEISHPNLRQIYDVRSNDTHIEILEEYLEGEALANILRLWEPCTAFLLSTGTLSQKIFLWESITKYG